MNRFINKLRTMGALSDEEIGVLTQTTEHGQNFGPRVDLIREGDHAGHLLVVLDGWACRYKVLPNGARQIMAFLMPGDACDLNIWMVAQMDHSIQTLTQAYVVRVPKARVELLMENYPGIARAMYVSQLVDEGTLRAWIVSLGRRTSLERLAHLLLELHLRCIRVGISTGDVMQFPFSQMVVADALGITSVHINRVFQELRRAGAITLRRGELTLVDLSLLTRIAGFDGSYLHRRLEQAKDALKWPT